MTQSSYYGQPIIKKPIWKWEIPTYFFAGGVAGASSLIALAGRARGDAELARSARALAAAMAGASPILLISDLGRPGRFHHMLRVARPTSPMNLGSWLLAVYVPAAVAAWLLGKRGTSSLGLASETMAAALAPGLATYTAVLISDTAIPVWHEARRELPFVFVGSALSGAGAILSAVNKGETSANLAMLGSALGIAATRTMEKSLGEIGRPYRTSKTGLLARVAKTLSAIGIGVTALGHGNRKARIAGSGLMLAGAFCERWSIFRAGFDSANDPEYVVNSQRRRLNPQGHDETTIPKAASPFEDSGVSHLGTAGHS